MSDADEPAPDRAMDPDATRIDVAAPEKLYTDGPMEVDTAPATEPPGPDALDMDLLMFANAVNEQPDATNDPATLDQQIDEGLRADDDDLRTSVRAVKTSVKKEVAAAMDLSVDEFDNHFVRFSTETGKRFARAWNAYVDGYLIQLNASKDKGTRGVTSDTVLTYLVTKGNHYFLCDMDEDTDRGQWDAITWEGFIMWRLMTILYHKKTGILRANGFSQGVAFQLAWMLRCNRIYAKNTSDRARERRALAKRQKDATDGDEGPSTPPPAARQPKPTTPATQERRARAQRKAAASGMFGGGPRPVQQMRREKLPRKKSEASAAGGATAGSAKLSADKPSAEGAAADDSAAGGEQERREKPGATSRPRTRHLEQLAKATTEAQPDDDEPAAGDELEQWGSEDEEPLDEEVLVIGEDAQPKATLQQLKERCPLDADASELRQQGCDCRYHAYERVRRLCVGKLGVDGVVQAIGEGLRDEEALDEAIVGGDTNARDAERADQPLLTLARDTGETRETAKRQKWLDSLMSSGRIPRERLREAIAGLGIDPLTRRMHGSNIKLKWWQVATIWDAVSRIRAGQDAGMVLGDKVGLGKTYEALGILLQVSWRPRRKALRDRAIANLNR
jgi:hypothetical protein